MGKVGETEWKSPSSKLHDIDLRMLIQGFEAMSKGEHSLRSRQLWAACVELLELRKAAGKVVVAVRGTPDHTKWFPPLADLYEHIEGWKPCLHDDPSWCSDECIPPWKRTKS